MKNELNVCCSKLTLVYIKVFEINANLRGKFHGIREINTEEKGNFPNKRNYCEGEFSYSVEKEYVDHSTDILKIQ